MSTSEFEKGYIEGRATGALQALRACLRDLLSLGALPDGNSLVLTEGNSIPLAAQLAAERVEAIASARAICREFDLPNDWSDNLCLADILEKRIVRHLVRK
jgi:hypothetical protein